MKDTAPLVHFLIVFDHDRGALVRDIQEFAEAADATEAYSATEGEYSSDDRIEVVLIGSDSIDTVRRTHPNYFPGSQGLADRVEDLLRQRALSTQR